MLFSCCLLENPYLLVMVCSSFLPPSSLLVVTYITLKRINSNETVRKIRKNSVENTARDLSICDNLAAGVFFRVLVGKKTIFKRKRPVSDHNHLHYSIYPKKIYRSSEIVGKKRKPHFSGDLQLSFCQQITRSVPSFHSSVWMLNHSVPFP